MSLTDVFTHLTLFEVNALAQGHESSLHYDETLTYKHPHTDMQMLSERILAAGNSGTDRNAAL